MALAEELPVNEALQLYHAADAELGMPLEFIFINAVYQTTLTPREIEQVECLRNNCQGNGGNSDERELFEAAGRLIRMCRRQQVYVDQIKSGTSVNVIEIPMYYTNHLSIGDIGDIAAG